MDYLAAMRVYVRVVERGSMSAAARDLGIGQSTVSERIERLEAHLRNRLLLRNTRKISVTDAGAAFYELCKHAIEATDEALTLGREDTSLRGTVRIAAPHAVGEVVLATVLLRLRELHPQLKVDLVLNDRVVDPVTEGVDISLRLGDRGDGNFAAYRLGHVRRVLIAAPDYLERHGQPERPNDLVRHPFARVSGLFNDRRLPLLTAEQRVLSAPIDITFSVSHWRPLHALLLGGGAIGVLQEPVCFDDLAADRLKQILPGFTVPGFDLHALYPLVKPIPPRVRTIVSLLQSELPRVLNKNKSPT